MSVLGNDSENASDKQLLENFQQGSNTERKNAFSVIYQRYHLDVLRFIKSKVKSEADAEEIFSDVWVTAYRRWPNFEWRENTQAAQPLKSWLLTTANYKTLEYFRKIKRESQNIPLEDVIALIESKSNEDETTARESGSAILQERTKQLLDQALNKLNPKHKDVLMLTYYKGKNATQIGKILNMNPSTVRVYRKRGLEKLRKILAAYFPSKGEK